MSRQAQYAMLSRVRSPGSYAAALLRDDVRPLLAEREIDPERLSSEVQVREVRNLGLSFQGRDRDCNDLETLACALSWIISSKLAKLPQEVVDQVAGLAARVFDYPQVEELAARALAPDAELGRKRRDQQQRFGKTRGIELRAERKPVWDEWQAAADALGKKNPRHSVASVARALQPKFGGSAETIRKHIAKTW